MRLNKAGLQAEKGIEILSNKRPQLVKLKPKTGRRHQLRLHCRFAGAPIIGDLTYNENAVKLSEAEPRLCLHAAALYNEAVGRWIIADECKFLGEYGLSVREAVGEL